jgi:cytochrome c553
VLKPKTWDFRGWIVSQSLNAVGVVKSHATVIVLLLPLRFIDIHKVYFYLDFNLTLKTCFRSSEVKMTKSWKTTQLWKVTYDISQGKRSVCTGSQQLKKTAISIKKWMIPGLLMSLFYTPLAFSGDIEAGKAKSATCAGCHGTDGNSGVPAFPKLAGQGEKYLVKQLQDSKSGARLIPEMVAFVQNLSDEDMRDIAAYYASQTSTIEGVDPELKPLGEKVFRAGNADSGLPSCMGCHGPAGAGIASAGFPKLSGQHAEYTANQLKAYRASGRDDSTGKRRENAMMSSIAAKMSDKEIQAVASYLSGLHSPSD